MKSKPMATHSRLPGDASKIHDLTLCFSQDTKPRKKHFGSLGHIICVGNFADFFKCSSVNNGSDRLALREGLLLTRNSINAFDIK